MLDEADPITDLREFDKLKTKKRGFSDAVTAPDDNGNDRYVVIYGNVQLCGDNGRKNGVPIKLKYISVWKESTVGNLYLGNLVEDRKYVSFAPFVDRSTVTSGDFKIKKVKGVIDSEEQDGPPEPKKTADGKKSNTKKASAPKSKKTAVKVEPESDESSAGDLGKVFLRSRPIK